MRQFAWFAVAACAAAATPAHAEGAGDKPAAEALFAEGKHLMAAGNYAQACPKLAASQRLDPGVGTMLNLADCFEKNGQTASAWAEFHEAISAARDARSPQRERLARERARALEPRLSRLTMTIAGTPPRDLHIARDGEDVDPALLGTAIPVDPGTHIIEAAAAGKLKWTKTVEVASGAQIAIAVPPLVDAPAAAPSDAAAASSPSSPPPSTGVVAMGTGDSTAPPSSEADSPDDSTRRAIALGIGAAGVVGITLGTVFGLEAASHWSDVKSQCPALSGCSDQTLSLRDEAHRQATISTIAFIAGGVGAVTGVVLWLTAKPSTSSAAEAPRRAGGSWSVAMTPSSVLLRGSF